MHWRRTDTAPSPHRRLRDMQAAPNRTVAALPPRQRASLVLRYYHDYSYAAVGEALGITEGAAGALLSRALDRLRDELDRSAGTIRP